MKGSTLNYQVKCYAGYGALLHTFNYKCKTGERARDKARKQLYNMGKQPNRMTLVAMVLNEEAVS